MIKKILLTGTMLAWFLMPQIANAPALRNSERASSLENQLELERTISKINENLSKARKKLKILAEEQELLKKDKIYQTIDSFYKTINNPYIPEQYAKPIPQYITKKFVRSLIRAESEDKPWAKSKANARGLGQLTEGAWYDVEKENYLKNVFIPEKNIRATIKCLVYIDKLCRQYHPNWERLEDKEKLNLIAASYNGGFWGLKDSNWDIAKRPDETRRYVPKIHEVSKNFIPSAEIYQSVF